MSRKKLLLLCTMIFLCFLFLMRVAQSSSQDCPQDMIIQAQNCFSQFAHAVHPAYQHADEGQAHKQRNEDIMGNGGAQGGSMILDYSQIKKYCARDGHITKFVTCIEDLVTRCKNSPQAALVDRLVSPERIREAVPNLCSHQNDVDASSACLTQVMNEKSKCRENAYAKVKSLMSDSARNATAMFLTQCRFFHSLAECQRAAVSDKCGSNLGDLHANFLLSFVPKSCTSSDDIMSLGPGNTTQTVISVGYGGSPNHKSLQTVTTRPSNSNNHGNGAKNSGNTFCIAFFLLPAYFCLRVFLVGF